MATKIFFVGNSIAGDDGVGPYLYDELKDLPLFKEFQLFNMGVIGLDIISYLEENDSMIIVDAVYSDKDIGQVILLSEDNLSKDLPVAFCHDFGIEQTIRILRNYMPTLNKINIIGVNVNKIKPFGVELSDEIMKMIPSIKKDVIKHVMKLSKKS